MAGLVKRESKHLEPLDVFDRLDRMFDEWMRGFPFRWVPPAAREWVPEGIIRVDEFEEEGKLVIRAELPGVDPERDVEITVSDGALHIEAERREEEKVEEKGYVRRELRRGTFSRTLPLPEGVSESDITATYKNGILEIRVPAPKATAAKRIPIAKS